MKPRLVILLVVVILLAVVWAVKVSAPRPAVVDEAVTQIEDDANLSEKDYRELGTPLSKRPLPGREPPEEPELSVQVDVNTSSNKHRLDYYISEAHGYYVEAFQIEFWYKIRPDMQPADSPLRFVHHLEDYVQANQTLKDCLEVVPAELSQVGDEIGTSENWDARVIWHGRARVENPDPLPRVARIRTCD
jgi:hypothetical protein